MLSVPFNNNPWDSGLQLFSFVAKNFTLLLFVLPLNFVLFDFPYEGCYEFCPISVWILTEFGFLHKNVKSLILYLHTSSTNTGFQLTRTYTCWSISSAVQRRANPESRAKEDRTEGLRNSLCKLSSRIRRGHASNWFYKKEKVSQWIGRKFIKQPKDLLTQAETDPEVLNLFDSKPALLALQRKPI